MWVDALHPHKTLSVAALFTSAARNAVHGEPDSAGTFYGQTDGQPHGFRCPSPEKSDLGGIPGLHRGLLLAAELLRWELSHGEVVELLHVLRRWILLS